MSKHAMKPFLCTVSSLALLAFAGSALADGRDSLLHWWKVKDLNGDGLLQPSEFYDIMTLGAASPKTGTTVYQATEGVDEADLVTVETVDVYKPSMRKTVAEPVLHLHNPTNWVGGVLKCNYQAVEAAKACIGGTLVNNKREGTVFIRFKWDGRRFIKTGQNYNYSVLLYSDAYNAYSGWGWAVGFRCYDSGTSNSMYPFFRWGGVGEMGFSQSPHNSNFLIKKGYWYDMAVTFRREKTDSGEVMTRAMMFRGGDSGTGNRQYYYDKRSGALSKNSWQEKVTDGERISLGYHSYSGASGGTTFVDAKGSGDDSFIGSIHEVKEYTKYMDELELLQTMVDNDPECMIGSRNGKATEFSDTQAEDVYEPATMDWIRMRRTLTAANPLTVKFDLEANGHTLGRLVEMRFLKSAALAGERIKIFLNGRQFGSKRIPDDGEIRFFIKPSHLSAIPKDAETGRYPVTLLIARGDSLDTALTLDYLTVGGSWQIGAADNSTKGAGGTSDYYNYFYNIGQRTPTQVVGSIGNKGSYAPARLYFGLTDWAAANLDFKFTVKSVNQLTFPAYLTVNGDSANRHVFSDLSAYREEAGTNLLFQAGQLQPGNRFTFSCDMITGDISWDSFDYWKLEALMPKDFKNSDEGLMVLLK